jgi:5-methylcytosine-specific restriction endonuclease McrA
MKNCKKCNAEFEPKKGLLNYCSITCRNSRTWNEQDKLKKSISNKNSDKVKLANRTRPDNFWLEIVKKRKENDKVKIMNSNYEDLKFESLKKRIYHEQNGSCNRCGLKNWLDNEIPLELEHKDGNHFNNERKNLELLCPNCHALTNTWRGRNKTKQLRGKISDEKLLEVLLTNEWNMRKSLIEVGLAAKGGNYNRCHKLKKEYLTLIH